VNRGHRKTKNFTPEFNILVMLVEARLRKGLTQKELAEKAQTTQSVISRLERGEFSPSLYFLYRLTEALGVKLEISITSR
jgi:transcriptional regulator with XRE-family HTH domain